MLSQLLSEVRFRLRALLNRGRVERELDAELRFHLERETEKHVSAGINRTEAGRRAHASFGGIERIKDDTRDVRGTAALEGVLQDLRYAVRGLRARPAFTLGILLTLGLGIGANAAMFGVVDRVLLRPPAMMRDPSRVHRLYRESVDDGRPSFDRNFAFPTFLDLKRDATAFSDVAAFQTTRLAIGDGNDITDARVTVASANYFNFFDAKPATGRFFTASEDELPAGAKVVVLGYDFWQNHFGGRNLLGEPLRLGSDLFTIVGVAPKNFTGMTDQAMPAAYIPITAYAFGRRPNYPTGYGWSWLEVIARRKDDVDLAAANANATSAFMASWRNAYAANAGWGTPEKNRIRGLAGPVLIERGPQAGRESRVAVWVGGVALIVLLIACANVANLMLARGLSRRREIAMRLALGVSRARLVRQLLTETALLAVAGGAAGLVIAQWGGATIRRLFLPPEFGDAVVGDGRTLAFTAVATLVAALLTGLVPAWNAGREDVVNALKSGASDGGGRRSRLRTGLLVFQAALSVLLLVGAGLFVRSLTNARGVRLGYDTDSVMVATLNLRGARIEPAQLATLMPRFLDAARSMPGVARAAFAASTPFQSNDQMPIFIEGVDSTSKRGRFLIQFMTPGYLEAMGTRIIRGRAIDETDGLSAEHVTVISEGMARVLWPDRDAIGQCFRIDKRTEPCARIVGVTEDIRLRNFVDPREFTYYVPVAQYPQAAADATVLFIRTKGVAADLAAPMRARLQEVLPAPAYVIVQPMSRLVDPSFRAWRFAATMFVAFGGLALALAAIGLYSLVSYEVAQRTRDMSVRIALGATRQRVVGLVVWSGVRVVAVGVAAGGLLAAWAAPRMETLMFHQRPLDPLVFGVVILTLGTVGCIAALAPALRASRVDPAFMLRAE